MADEQPSFPESTDERPTAWIVTGSSGFIGQRLCKLLLAQGYRVYGIDKRVSPYVRKPKGYVHVRQDLIIAKVTRTLSIMFRDIEVIAVVHLAGLICVSEGEKEKDLYYKSNVVATENVINFIMMKMTKQVNPIKFIFASSAAVYDSTRHEVGRTLKEDDPTGPVSYYGQTKLECENIISSYVAMGLEAVILRFFNVAGGMEIHYPSIHLIPIIVERIVEDQSISIFGKNHPTADGTGIRDYFHVQDLIEAINLIVDRWETVKECANMKTRWLEYKATILGGLASLNLTDKRSGFMRIYNLGSGSGYSVMEVCRLTTSIVRARLGDPVDGRLGTVEFRDARPCDPPVLLADVSRILIDLQWTAQRSLKNIIRDTVREMIALP